jgi:hypothetical protein
MLEETSRFTPHPDVVETILATGEVVLLHLQTKAYFSLNETGSRIWKLLKEDSSIGRISQDLESSYEVTDEEARNSVRALLDELAAAKLVVPSPQAP